MTVDMHYFSLYENYQEKYNQLKQKFIEIASLHINAANLQNLKQFYDSVINSKRASDNIKDLLDLIKILEKRLELSYNKIEAFKYIASTFVKDPVLDVAIKEYELQLENQRKLPPLNVYKCKSVSPISSVSPSTSIEDDSGFTAASQIVLLNSPTTFQSTHQPPQQVSRGPQQSSQPTAFQSEVFQYLSENLGRSWRDLARFLDVKEAEIDSIDLKTHYDYKNRALEALEIFRRRCDPCNWKKKLIKSLEIIRRRDLAEHVTDMILQGNNN
ncbi:fas-associated death domain protein [Chelonus insularis]|uniref:fas-associated death domain protein n=1 Tax=Chelonus insularis TaxID=460826 RepID=UPI001588C690|nr:fas-associated death domain protein [Chelonus insularis]